MKRVGVSMGLVIGVAFSQTNPTFEAVSVRASKAEVRRFTMNGGPGTNDPDRISYTNVMLRRVLLRAYDVKDYQISGPAWLDTARFDIAATIPHGTSTEQFQGMLRNLLKTRFGMVTHRESREVPIYALLTAKNGLRIRPAVKDSAAVDLSGNGLAAISPSDGKDGFPVLSLPGPGLVIETRKGVARITAKEVPLDKLADLLSGRMERPVVDTTGMTENYSFVVYFTPAGATPGEFSEPSIFGALQEQLGLRLEARKGPIEMLVVDQAKQTPTEN